MTTRVGSSRGRRCVRRAARCPAEHGAHCGGGGCCRAVPWGWCPSGKCSGGVLPQNSITPNEQHDPYAQGEDLRLRPCQGKVLSSGPGPGLKGKGSQTPKRRKEPQNPPTSAGARAGFPTGGVEREAERGKKLSPKCVLNRSGGEGGKLRWLLAGLCSSAQPEDSNFPKKYSKTKSAPFGPVAFVPPCVGQASAFRGSAGPLRAADALRKGFQRPLWAPPASHRLPPHPAPLAPADPAPPPRLSPPLKHRGGSAQGGVCSGTLPGAPGTPGAASSPRRPHPAPGLPRARRPAAAIEKKTWDEKVEGLMFSDRYK